MAEALADGLSLGGAGEALSIGAAGRNFPEEHFGQRSPRPSNDLSGDSGSSSVKISDKLSDARKLSGRSCRTPAACKAERGYASTEKCQTAWLGGIDLRFEYIFEVCVPIGPI
jgi:hypothetical protein